MQSLLFSPEVQAISGALGISFALWSIQRRREGKAMHPDAARSDRWLLVFSVPMLLIGLWRWHEAWTATISAVAPA
ncbi:hypothetical protein IP78_13665 [Brevundimonas sp. AAP58]|uniref:hypothetical protein n=1 Tax=Brevundimonas sp. AAP58 TaxID=1523422 RepID=UPI0006B95A9F|nr:hypothetical protein [Brevundimonas sp. AAP58]KPF75224.1 hypothetical protein IP78_13665 [Brevundimonas sp. AAP58]